MENILKLQKNFALRVKKSLNLKMNLEYLSNLLKNTDCEIRADEILEEYSKKHMKHSEEMQQLLAEDYDCDMCLCCGRYFDSTEMAENDYSCIYCNGYEDEV